MFGKEKKTYDAPVVHKFAVDDENLGQVTGGIQARGGYKEEHDAGADALDSNANLGGVDKSGAQLGQSGEVGNGDVGKGRGRGGGCDGVAYHRNARTFSSGRNSGC